MQRYRRIRNNLFSFCLSAYLHTSCRVSILFNGIRNQALDYIVGAFFSSRGKDSASCPYRRSPVLLQQRKLPAVVYGCMNVSIRLGSWGSGAMEIATWKVIPPGSLELAQVHRATKPLAMRIQPSAVLGPVTVDPSYPHSGVGPWNTIWIVCGILALHIIPPRYALTATMWCACVRCARF